MNNVPAVTESFILFELAGASYALRSRDIQQLEMVGQVTPVPNAAEFVDGVVSVRGQVLPAINLRKRFGFKQKDADLRSRLLIVNVADRAVAMIVDSAREFIAIDPGAIQPPPEGVAGMSGQYLEGIAHVNERLVLVLDAAQIIEGAAQPAA